MTKVGLALFAVSAIGCNLIFGVRSGEPSAASGDCQPSKPAVCAADRLTDSEACCVVGRSCQGGACSNGECAPVSLANAASGSGQALSVVVADRKVIWSTGLSRTIYAVDLDGGARSVLVAPGESDAFSTTMLALDEARRQVYFTDSIGPTIGRVDVSGGQIIDYAQIPAADASTGLGRMVVHDGYLYVAVDYQVTTAGTSGIYRVPTGAAGPYPVTMEKVIDIQGAFGLAAADGYLYFGDYATHSLNRVPVAGLGAGATPEVLVDNLTSLGDIAVSGDHVYWAVENQVYSHGLTPGGPAVPVYVDQAWIWGIFADADYVYWTTYDDAKTIPGALRRMDVALQGDAHLVHQTAPGGALTGIAGDCDTVYFLEEEGELRKVSK